MVEICPLPEHWHRVYQECLEAAQNSNGKIPEPPRPLILGGWAYSNDVQKCEQWHAMVEWAKKWGFEASTNQLTPEMMHVVENPSDYTVGPQGGPMYLPWNFDPKPVISEDQIKQAMNILIASWPQISGKALCEVTRPLAFTGSKSRRLIVYANPSANPPWGSWTELSHGPQRREFSRFRSAINTAISPLFVDHIDFVHEETRKE